MVERTSHSTFAFAVINSGKGLEYHPSSYTNAFEEPPTLQKQMVVIAEDVPAERILDGAFWYMLYKMVVWPAHIHTAEVLYEKLLSALNAKPLTANYSSGAQSVRWRAPPHGTDTSFFNCAWEALHFLASRKLSPAKADYLGLLMKWQMGIMVQKDLKITTDVLSGSDFRFVRQALQQLAGAGALAVRNTDRAMLTPALTDALQALVTEIDGALTAKLAASLATSSEHHFAAQVDISPVGQGSVEHHLFDRLLRTEDVEKLIGNITVPPIFRPVEMTLVPDLASSLEEVALTLRHCDHLCTLIAYQSATIKNTYFLRCALIQHVFTRTIPLPLPANHPERTAQCFWSQPLRYETQLDIMRLLDLLCKHYAACVLSMPLTRTFDAARVLTLSCMAVMSDALMRKHACDVPSLFCLHFSGQHDSKDIPQQPYGFDIGSSFAVQSEAMLFTDANLCALRSKVLDYFHQQKAEVTPDHVIFEWESTMQCGSALERLFGQLCHEVGFPHEDLPQYLTGQKPEVLTNYPEFKHYRDIVFTFKFMLSPTHETFPKLRPWFQKEANLAWSYTAKEGYAIQGFDMLLKCDFETEEDKKKSGIAGFFRNIFSKDGGRAPPSGADPSLLLGEKINNEDDVLYVRPLPDFDNRLSQRDVELLLSYLTVPYIRMPLVLRFFAAPERIGALGCAKLRQVLDDVLFEPSSWQADDEKSLPATIPGTGREYLLTPVGLLFNELIYAPHGILKPIETM
jgi:hypothetical protein